ncbi:4-fold beta flower protein [Staphylococcus equorum]|uniref:4-fold beta flower domain-containing protein n=1 Tax=Staphylococcus equorum TaxID=246432 RepID=A0A9X4R2W5_9STAP|nr:hypothetical protein [Staphylococcus equorum]MDG0860339.1 hypothetical protein [Staphylococcus equorum]
MDKHLYDLKGKHIAKFRNGKLYTKKGKHVGWYNENKEIFISNNGNYIGEIKKNDRLLMKKNSPNNNILFPSKGSSGNIPSSGTRPSKTQTVKPLGYEDIDAYILK